MANIQRLDAHLTNMIAAGEVVERPMGVIKELVENSIDAKATRIEVQIEQGGTQLMEVTDNGVGMDKEDACLAFERHATSKIKTTDDLWCIHSLGFRGEALPSIASVSNLMMLTNNGSDSTRIEIRYGQREIARPFPSNQGTQISVRGLFQKTPARLKHLKSIPYETSLIQDLMQKFALSYPTISFRLIHDGKELFRSSGNGNLLEVMSVVYGRDLAKQCIEIKAKDYDYTIQGLIALPAQNRASRNYMTVFVNERMIRSYRIQKAILDSYKDYIPQDRYPIAVLDVRMDSKLCDVNVHPSKWEIRLSKEQQLEHLIRETLNVALREHMMAPEVNLSYGQEKKEKVEMTRLFESEHLVQEPVQTYTTTTETNESISVTEKVNQEKLDQVSHKPNIIMTSKPVVQPISYPKGTGHSRPVQHEIKEEPQLAEKKQVEVITEDLPNQEEISAVTKQKFPAMQVLAQMHGRYILAQDEEALYIVDQHAAQERVHFEEVEKNFLEQNPTMQDLLVPIILEASQTLAHRLDEVNEVLAAFHIELENFGQNSLVCRSLPVWMRELDEQAFLQDLVDLWKDEKEVRPQDLRRDRLATMACHHSIRFNRILSLEEMQQVIEQLANCVQPYHCPHGRPTFISITEKQLIKEFHR